MGYWIKKIRNATSKRKKNHTKSFFKEKVDAYQERYIPYLKPGHQFFSRSINFHFMNDPRNYRFEWYKLNSSEGGKITKKYPYRNYPPQGMKVAGDRFVPK